MPRYKSGSLEAAIYMDIQKEAMLDREEAGETPINPTMKTPSGLNFSPDEISLLIQGLAVLTRHADYYPARDKRTAELLVKLWSLQAKRS